MLNKTGILTVGKQVLALVLAVSVLAGTAGAAAPIRKIRYLALGDSISTGYKLDGSHFENEAFTQITAAKNNYVLTNQAVDGYTTEDIWNQIKDGKLDTEIKSADLITITCGGNDMLQFLSESVDSILSHIFRNTTQTLEENEILPEETTGSSAAVETDSAETEPTETEPASEQTAPVPETDAKTEETSGEPVDFAALYGTFDTFIQTINSSLAYVEETKNSVPIWERIAYTVLEQLITRLLGYTESMLVDFTEREEYAAALQKYETNLKNVTQYIHAKNSDATIIVLTQYNPYRWYTTPACTVIRNFIDSGICHLNEVIKTNASECGYLVADVYSAFVFHEESLANATEIPLQLDVHPNVEGHAVIAECLQKVLDEHPITINRYAKIPIVIRKKKS